MDGGDEAWMFRPNYRGGLGDLPLIFVPFTPRARTCASVHSRWFGLLPGNNSLGSTLGLAVTRTNRKTRGPILIDMTEPNMEAIMASKLRDGDYAGATELFGSVGTEVNTRMVNMAFSAAIGAGRNIEGAAVEMLQACDVRKLQPSVAMYNNVLAALTKRGPPEAVLSWLAKMRSCGVALDVKARRSARPPLHLSPDVPPRMPTHPYACSAKPTHTCAPTRARG